jgi:hypothetical protein
VAQKRVDTMKPKTYARLQQLEQRSAARVSALRKEESGTSAIDTIRELLSAAGIEREANESLAETTARALGITCRELRVRMSQGRLLA